MHQGRCNVCVRHLMIEGGQRDKVRPLADIAELGITASRAGEGS